MLGVVGQAITAANLLGTQAAAVFTGEQASVAVGLHVVGIVLGLVLGGFAALLFATATALTVRAFRHALPFSLTWWSFTFPIGTCVTGASALGGALGSALVDDLAVALFAVLSVAWATVATRTVRGTLRGTIVVPA
ncbi:tellurite resistance protein TehA-like permease [Rhodococcus sp. PvP016]|uniref:Tellurite resistance protein TehA-like permease n=1 Tax=Rhodococcoides corynebacterioides TaxID=53972 RepID=A0ABS2KRF0_9NOCA|nr:MULTISPECIES: hypothetical protein [Rhodococcus]MBM7413836.1 tellurite resistance protein TehA-like permease [Rhodococcus corynebacterioides]MBP1116299.1 tellurite resistance protein TehA-like permease [Rhodococcus sp. PvP016]